MDFLSYESISKREYTMIQLQHILVSHPELVKWIEEVAQLTQPKNIYVCNGSEQEYQSMIQLMIASGTLKALNPELRPDSYLACSDPSDVARVEDRTFVSSANAQDAGPNNNWVPPAEMKSKLLQLFNRSMQGRTLYVIPFCMGPIESPYSRFGVEITDSPYVVANMKLMTRMGEMALNRMQGKPFVKALHSVGSPLQPNQTDVAWPCNQDKYICHFPESNEIWSFGSGYGGNALLGKKCFALRIGSTMARKEGWLAEHMLIMGAQNPSGEKKYVLAAFPSACGKTNFAMMVPPPELAGWKITTVGDDIAWIHTNEQGEMHAINPEYGFFGVAPGTSYQTNPVAMDTIKQKTIFTNVALTPDGDVWWEGLTKTPPSHLTDWKGEAWTPQKGTPAAHPNARFTVNISQCPSLDEQWDNPLGVPVSAILFGGRRQNTLPLVFKPNSWSEGVYFGATIGSETTAAATGAIGVVRRDPMAMLPFCGYNMAQYFQHWLNFETKLKKPVALFIVNWFRKNSEGHFAWPGFGQNTRVLEWILNNLTIQPNKTQDLGQCPSYQDINWTGLEFNTTDWDELMSINPREWRQEVAWHHEFFARFEGAIPKELKQNLERLQSQYGS